MEIIKSYLPWLLSVITIYMTVLAGNKSKHAWLFGLGNQALWLIWIIATGAWGLIPMNIALWVVYARNHLKWSKASAPVVTPLDGERPFGGDMESGPVGFNR